MTHSPVSAIMLAMQKTLACGDTVVDINVRLRGAVALAWLDWKRRMEVAPTDSALGEELIARSLGLREQPRKRRKVG